jgi:predicted transcriptional regulator
MAKDSSEKSADDSKEKLKALREERSELISRNKEILKKQSSETGLIRKGLKEGNKTIPELAENTGLKSDLILYYVSAMKKFGEITEAGHAGGYFKYSLVEKKKAKKN